MILEQDGVHNQVLVGKNVGPWSTGPDLVKFLLWMPGWTTNDLRERRSANYYCGKELES